MEEEGEEAKEMKRQITSARDTEEERDRLSELPDCVLLHIMNVMNTKHAVQTCILSRRWKNLWKRLTTLCFFHSGPGSFNFKKFVSHVLARRDGSISLLNLCLHGYHPIDSELVFTVTKYAAFHNVQQLTIQVPFSFRNKFICFDPFHFWIPSLTSLKIFSSFYGPPQELPKSLLLPALKSLHLSCVSFTATSDNGYAEPFKACDLLNTLVLQRCSLHNDAQVLFISNSNLLSLKLGNTLRATTNNLEISQHRIVLSTPNLSSITVTNSSYSMYQPLSSICNLSCLKEGTIHTTTNISLRVFVGWLQVFTNVKILTLSYDTLKLILLYQSNLNAMSTQPPCFVRLETLKVKLNPHENISEEEVNMVVKYLLQNSPLGRVAVINCQCSLLNYSGVS